MESADESEGKAAYDLVAEGAGLSLLEASLPPAAPSMASAGRSDRRQAPRYDARRPEEANEETHMTAPSAMPGEEEIARAFYHSVPRNKPWDALTNEFKNQYRKQARAILALFEKHFALAAEAALAAERERCAVVAEELGPILDGESSWYAANQIAAAIRAGE